MKCRFYPPPQAMIQLFPRTALRQGATIKGMFCIGRMKPFRFIIEKYDVPSSDPSGGARIKISCGGRDLCTFYPRESSLPRKKVNTRLMKMFLLALRGAEGKITGVTNNDPVRFPLPDEDRCSAGML